MRDFSQNNRGGGRGGRRFGGGGGQRTMHKTTCSNCGRDCEVPFHPTGEKPVYCSDCFGERGGHDNRRSFSRDDRSPQSSRQNNQKQFDELNRKLDNILDVVLSINKTSNEAPVNSNPEEAPIDLTPDDDLS